MQRIVQQDKTELKEAWGDVVDRTEYLRDSDDFTRGRNVIWSQFSDRDDGKYRPLYETEQDCKWIRGVATTLYERVPMAKAWANRLLDYTVGTGFEIVVKHPRLEVQQCANAILHETLDNSNWTMELERESYVREVRDGMFLASIDVDCGSIRLGVVEPDALTQPANPRELEDWLEYEYGIGGFVPSWSFGVLSKRNAADVVFGYHIVRSADGYDWDFVPTDKSVVWKRNVPAKAKIGVSDYYTPHLYFYRADKVATNTAEGVALQAAIAYIVEHAPATTSAQAESIAARFSVASGRNIQGTNVQQRKRDLPSGTRLDVMAGQKYYPGPLGDNNSEIYISVLESALRLAGVVHAFPEGMLNGNYGNNNFASSLTAEAPFVQGRLAEQMQRGERLRVMSERVLKCACDCGMFRSVGIASWEELRAALKVETIPPKVFPRDVLALTQALTFQKQNGWVTDKTAMNELGRDWDLEIANGLKTQVQATQQGSEQMQGTQQVEEIPPNAAKPAEGVWMGLSTLQLNRNAKAIAKVQTGLADGSMSTATAEVLLATLGLSAEYIAKLIADASDKTIDDPVPVQESVQEQSWFDGYP